MPGLLRGDRGSLFLTTVDLMNDVRLKTKPRKFGFLYENVVMRPSMADEVSQALDAQPVLECASDFGWVNRPRLWWTSIDWQHNPNDPVDDKPLQRSRQGKWQRLRLAMSSFVLDGQTFPEGVASGRLSMPTATTPAMDENGRPAPKSSRGKIPPDAHARWLADCRQFAPWH